MSTADVLQLDEYRDRRQQRLARTRVFAAPDPDRTALFGLMAEIAGLAGADRVGIVWVDEYGPDHAHPYFVLDYACSPPRQHFPSQPLSRAWEAGVPGALDETYAAGSTFAVALGSDGARGWFVVADAFTRRARITDAARARIMFLVGECSAVVLHKDLGSGSSLMTGVGGSAFLRDLDGKDDKPLARAMIERRFAVGRLGRLMVDEDLSVDQTERVETTRRLREELAAAGPLASEEGDPYHAALDAFERNDVGALSRAMLDIGVFAEAEDHVYGALQAYAVAFDLAGRLHDAGTAIDAARFSGRLLRRRAKWELADLWYQIALDVARLERMDAKTVLVMTGIAGVQRERGNLPGARATVDEAIELAGRSGSSESVAVARHTMMGILQVMGDFDDALRHGWTAYHTYAEGSSARTQCLTGIAALLKEMGDLEASEDAFVVVAHTARFHYYRVYAYDALSHIAALNGDEAEFDRRAAESDALGWDSGPPAAKAEILLYRGLSLRALGRLEEAEAWLERALDFASTHKFNSSLFRAENALNELRAGKVAETEEAAADAEPAFEDVREGLREMRALVHLAN